MADVKFTGGDDSKAKGKPSKRNKFTPEILKRFHITTTTWAWNNKLQCIIIWPPSKRYGGPKSLYGTADHNIYRQHSKDFIKYIRRAVKAYTPTN